MKRSGGKMWSLSKKLCSFLARLSSSERDIRDKQTDANTKKPVSVYFSAYIYGVINLPFAIPACNKPYLSAAVGTDDYCYSKSNWKDQTNTAWRWLAT